jgi:hypothetical protein
VRDVMTVLFEVHRGRPHNTEEMDDVDQLANDLEFLALERLGSGDGETNTRRRGSTLPVLTAEEHETVSACLRTVQEYIDMFSSDPSCAVSAQALNHVGDATNAIRVLLSREAQPPMVDLIELGADRLMLKLASVVLNDCDFDPSTQDVRWAIAHEALWAINNLASGPSDCTNAVAQAGALDLLVPAATHDSSEIATIACWAIGNIAGDGRVLRDFTIERGSVNAVIGAIQRHANSNGALNGDLLRNCTWALSNLVRFKPGPPAEVVEPVLMMASTLLATVADDEVTADALWCFSYAVEGPAAQHVLAFTISSGLLPGIVASVLHDNPIIVAAALRLAGSVATGDDSQTEAILDAGGLDAVVTGILQSKFGRLEKEAYWFLSNVAAGTASQIERLLQPSSFDATICAFELPLRALSAVGNGSHHSWELLRESVWTVCNVVSGATEEQLSRICSYTNNHDGSVCVAQVLCAYLVEFRGRQQQLDNTIIESINRLFTSTNWDAVRLTVSRYSEVLTQQLEHVDVTEHEAMLVDLLGIV